MSPQASAGCSSLNETIGLIAGYGRFPLIAADALKARGLRVVAAAVKGEADQAVQEHVDACTWLAVGRLRAALAFFRKHGCKKLLMAGKVRKVHLFRNFLPDMAAMKLLASLKDWRDDTILAAIADFFEEKGMPFLSQLEVAPSLVAPEGVIAGPRPDAKVQKEMRFGFRHAKAIAGLDVGQTVVVERQAVLAVEAIEGTDEAIRRGGALGAGRAVVVKVAKPCQDPRFDVPAVGPDTIRTMAEAGCRWLAVEAGWVLLLERERLIAEAERAGIGVYGIREDRDA